MGRDPRTSATGPSSLESSTIRIGERATNATSEWWMPVSATIASATTQAESGDRNSDGISPPVAARKATIPRVNSAMQRTSGQAVW